MEIEMHLALSRDIHINSSWIAAQRREVTRLILTGRRIREDSRDAFGVVRSPRAMTRGIRYHALGMSMLKSIEEDRNGRRVRHLAAALLNGKTLLECERKRNPEKTPEADPEAIAEYILPHLPEGEQEHVETIARVWVQRGDMRLTDIREKGLDKIIKVDHLMSLVSKARHDLDALVAILHSEEEYCTQLEKDLAAAKARVSQRANAVEAGRAALLWAEDDLRDTDGTRLGEAALNLLDDGLVIKAG